MVSTSSPIPLYHQVFSILRQRIHDGTYAANEKLPTEDELATEFKVSRATLRQAVGDLVRDGLVSRKQGRGTFINPVVTQAVGQQFRGSIADLMSETRRARIKDVEVAHDYPLPPRIAEMLHIVTGKGTVVRRSRTMDGRLFAYTINYLPPKYGELLSRSELRTSGLMTLLESKGVHLVEAKQAIRAQLADPNVSQRLDIDFAAAVLFVERVIFDPDREPVEVVQSWYRGDVYEYTVSLDLNAPDDFKAQLA